MIVGVGGQGSLLASKLLGHLLMTAGYDVKVSEVHGMSPVSYTHLPRTGRNTPRDLEGI